MPTLQGTMRKGQARARQGQDGLVTYEEERHYLVQADFVGQNQLDILATAGVPQVNTTLTGGQLMCQSVTASMRAANATLYDVTATFSSQVRENTDPETPQQGDPTAWTPIADVEFEPYTEVVRKDVNDKPWVNSANKPFEVGLEIPRRLAVSTFTQFEKLSGLTVENIMQDRSDRVNSTTYKGFPKKSLLLQVNRAQIGFFYRTRCWRIEYTIKYKDQDELPGETGTGGWTVQQLDAGWEYYDASNNLQRFEDADGNPVPGLLDGDGGALADQQSGTPKFEAFQIYKETNFNTFLRW